MVQHVTITSSVNEQSVEPVWTGVLKLSEILPTNIPLILHAGPPFKSASELPMAVRHSVLIGIMYEGWAADKEEAIELLNSGKLILAPAQDYGIVVPLAGVATPSMYAIEVSDFHKPENKKYSVLNEGMQWCTRLGIFATEMLSHLTWLHHDFGFKLAQQFKSPVQLAPILQASLLNGDDGHARTMHASKLLADIIVSWGVDDQISQSFLYGAMAWALNYWMAASALILANQPGDNAIISVGGNGLRFGLKLAKDSNTWLTVKAPSIAGNKDIGNEQAIALGTIGDSAVVDFVGLGGQCLDLASLSAKNLRDFLPDDYLNRQEQFLSERLPFLGGRLGVTNFDSVINTNTGPLVLLGMIEESGQRGRIGGGVATVDADLLNQLEAWQDEETVV